jgi:DNA-binding transcriptional ArsR family regulator
MQMITKIFKVLANEKRLKILKLLIKGGELNVGEITTELKMPFITISRHLEKLRSVDLVVSRESGLKLYYSIAPLNDSLRKILLSLINKEFRS